MNTAGRSYTGKIEGTVAELQEVVITHQIEVMQLENQFNNALSGGSQSKIKSLASKLAAARVTLLDAQKKVEFHPDTLAAERKQLEAEMKEAGLGFTTSRSRRAF